MEMLCFYLPVIIFRLRGCKMQHDRSFMLRFLRYSPAIATKLYQVAFRDGIAIAPPAGRGRRRLAGGGLSPSAGYAVVVGIGEGSGLQPRLGFLQRAMGRAVRVGALHVDEGNGAGPHRAQCASPRYSGPQQHGHVSLRHRLDGQRPQGKRGFQFDLRGIGSGTYSRVNVSLLCGWPTA